jgi:hypothetical protein
VYTKQQANKLPKSQKHTRQEAKKQQTNSQAAKQPRSQEANNKVRANFCFEISKQSS